MAVAVVVKDNKPDLLFAASLDEAYSEGKFGTTMPRTELLERITRYNPDLKLFHTARHTGLYDSRNGFICGITHGTSIPEYTILRYDKKLDRTLEYTDQHGEATGKEVLNTDDEKDKLLARGWRATIKIIQGHGYRIDMRGL